MATVVGHDPSAVKRCTCGNCAAVIEYVPNDVKERKYAYDYLGDYEVGDFVKCPKCRKWVHV